MADNKITFQWHEQVNKPLTSVLGPITNFSVPRGYYTRVPPAPTSLIDWIQAIDIILGQYWAVHPPWLQWFTLPSIPYSIVKFEYLDAGGSLVFGQVGCSFPLPPPQNHPLQFLASVKAAYKLSFTNNPPG